MKTSPLLVTLGLLLCAGLGVALLEIKADIHTLAARQTESEHVTHTLKAELVATRHEVGNDVKYPAAEAAQAEQWRKFGRIPADRIRQLVAPTLASIKAAQAGRPARPRQPPPPSGPMGNLFPELMGEPRYSLLAKQREQLLMSLTCRPRLQQAGVPPQTIDRVLDLLAEQRMVELDYQSLRAQYRPNAQAAYVQQQTAVAKIDGQIRAALGQPLFNQLSSPVPQVTAMVHADGTVTQTTTMTRELTPYGNPLRAEFQPLETRLSYSPEPLSAEQVSQLTSIFTAYMANGSFFSSTAISLPEVRAVLSPFQLRALAELQAEHDASLARAKLPGS